jgi:hypothetical protein
MESMRIIGVFSVIWAHFLRPSRRKAWPMALRHGLYAPSNPLRGWREPWNQARSFASKRYLLIFHGILSAFFLQCEIAVATV